jgi:hypothetical protein
MCHEDFNKEYKVIFFDLDFAAVDVSRSGRGSKEAISSLWSGEQLREWCTWDDEIYLNMQMHLSLNVSFRCTSLMHTHTHCYQSEMVGYSTLSSSLGGDASLFNDVIDILVNPSDDDATKLFMVADRLSPDFSKVPRGDPNLAAQRTATALVNVNRQGLFNHVRTTLQNANCSMNIPGRESYPMEPLRWDGNCGKQYGYELMLSHTLTYKYNFPDPFASVKIALPASSLFNDWYPETGTQWPLLKRAIQNTPGQWAAFVWNQGSQETWDADENRYLTYEGNLTYLIEKVRKVMYAKSSASSAYACQEEIPVIVVQQGYWPDGNLYPKAKAIRQQQARVCAKDPRAELVKTDDLGQYYHYDAASYLVIGYRIAEAYMKLANADYQCSTSSPVTPNPPLGICFSSASSVWVQDKGRIPIQDLQIGDRVSIGYGKYDTVYSFGHRDNESIATFVQIHAKGLDKPLELSHNHLVFVQGSAVPSSSISVGDMIDLGDGGVADVYRIASVQRRGLYSPFTLSGTIVVDGVVASTYVSLQGTQYFEIDEFKTPLSHHWMAHAFMSFPRIVCNVRPRWCENEQYDESGISMWVAGPFKLFMWMLSRNGSVVSLTMIVLIPVLIFGVLAESVLQHHVLLVALTVIAFIGCRNRRREVKSIF